MSSVDWRKVHNGSTELIKLISHAARYDDVSADSKVHYRNGFIDKRKTHENYKVSARRDRFGGVRFFEIARLQDRIKRIDTELPPRRRRKDRVVAISFCVYKPEGISEENERAFFEMAYQHIAACCGGEENLTVGYVHRDEIHQYIDAITGEKRTSVAHMHVIGIPYLPGIGINGKQFMTADRMQALNESIDNECQRCFGCQFLTGVKSRSGRSVEDLSLASEKKALEMSREREKEYQKKLEEVKKEEEQLEKKRDRLRAEEKQLKEKYTSIAKAYNRLLAAYRLLRKKAEELRIAIDDRELSKTLMEMLP